MPWRRSKSLITPIQPGSATPSMSPARDRRSSSSTSSPVSARCSSNSRAASGSAASRRTSPSSSRAAAGRPASCSLAGRSASRPSSRSCARGKTSPIVGWLRSYAASVHADTGADIGVVGMCLTGGFALAMAVDTHVVAPVVAHPALPFGFGSGRQADLGLSPSDLAAIKHRSDLAVKGVRFSCDLVAPARRFDRLQEELGDRFVRTDVPSGRGTPLGFSRWEHSVLNNARIQPTNPNHDAARAELDRVVDEVLDFLESRLRRRSVSRLIAGRTSPSWPSTGRARSRPLACAHPRGRR